MIAYIASVFLAILMFGMGLELTLGDFRRIAVFPRAAAVGLVGQLICLPLLGALVASALDVTPEFAVGVVLLTLCPGGALSNLFSYLAKADVALSVTLTSVSSLVTVFTIPVGLNLALLHFMATGAAITLPLGPTILQIMLITVVPVSAGMYVLHRWPRFAGKAAPAVRIGSMAFLPMMLVGMALHDQEQWLKNLVEAGALALALTVLATCMGWLLGRLFRMPRRQVVTIAIEVGAQNAMLGAAIAVSPYMLNNMAVGIVPTVYGLTMVVVLAVYVALLNWLAPLDEVAAEAAPGGAPLPGAVAVSEEGG